MYYKEKLPDSVPSVLLGATGDSDRFAAINILVIRLEFLPSLCLA